MIFKTTIWKKGGKQSASDVIPETPTIANKLKEDMDEEAVQLGTEADEEMVDGNVQRRSGVRG